MDTTVKWCMENYPQIGLILAIAIGVGFLTWKASRIFSRLERVEDKTGNIERDIVGIKKDISSINSNLNGLISYLAGKDKNFKPDLFISKSPIQLSPLGLKVLEDSGGKELIDRNIDAFMTEMEAKFYASALDVQNDSFIIIFNKMMQDPLFTPIKDFIYQNPVLYKETPQELTIDMPTLSNVMSIYLRDKYLEKHQEIKD